MAFKKPRKPMRITSRVRKLRPRKIKPQKPEIHIEREMVPTGERYQYLRCPMCFWKRPVWRAKRKMNEPASSADKEPMNFSKFNPEEDDFMVVQERGYGRGGGFWIVQGEGKTIKECADDEDIVPFIEQIKLQCKRILHSIGE